MTASAVAGRKILVVGLGDTGWSCVRWMVRQGAEVRATDSRDKPPHALRVRSELPQVTLTLGAFSPADFAWAEMIVVSPGVPLATPEIQAAIEAGKEVAGDVELFARAIRGRGGKVIAITGSNGKSTVTSLAGHLCAAAGLRTVVAGNIGLPVLDALTEVELKRTNPQVWVLELSSFQLETTATLEPDAATVLNVSQDHMDRYPGMAEYAAAKARVFAGTGVQVLNREDAVVMAMAQPGRRVVTFGLDAGATPDAYGLVERDGRHWLAKGHERLFDVAQLPIAGLHNAANALAALALCSAVGVPYAPMLAALGSFHGLAHRVEKVAEIDGIRFYDDSKGTNVGATVAALNGFTVPVVLIAGGDGKGQDFSPLRAAVAKARAVVLIGRDGPLIEAAIGGAVAIKHAASMEEAVRLSFAIAREGDAVLLSPACASFDMFRNYVHRAEVFVAAVRALQEQKEMQRVP